MESHQYLNKTDAFQREWESIGHTNRLVQLHTAPVFLMTKLLMFIDPPSDPMANTCPIVESPVWGVASGAA